MQQTKNYSNSFNHKEDTIKLIQTNTNMTYNYFTFLFRLGVENISTTFSVLRVEAISSSVMTFWTTLGFTFSTAFSTKPLVLAVELKGLVNSMFKKNVTRSWKQAINVCNLFTRYTTLTLMFNFYIVKLGQTLTLKLIYTTHPPLPQTFGPPTGYKRSSNSG